MKRLVLILMCSSASFSAFGQVESQTAVQKQQILNRLNSGNLSQSDVILGIPQKEGGVVGSVYLNDEWDRCTIKLKFYKESLSIDEANLNVHNNTLEVKVNGEIRVINAHDVSYFEFYDGSKNRYFINTNEYPVANEQAGFFEVLYDGPVSLLLYNYTTVKKANYNLALDMGSKDDEILKQKKYFAALTTKGLIEIRRKKDLFKAFPKYKSEISTYLKERQLKLNKPTDLIEVFGYCNGLN